MVGTRVTGFYLAWEAGNWFTHAHVRMDAMVETF